MNTAKPLAAFLICILVVFLSLGIAALAQGGFGTITVRSGVLEGHDLAYKLFIPRGADGEHPVPAVLAMHGYQNDRETSAAYGI